MEMWFSEIHTPNIKLTIRTDRQLFSGESEYQRIDVFDSPERWTEICDAERRYHLFRCR